MQAVAAASDMHSAEVLLSNLPEVVSQAIGAPMPFPDRHFAVFIIFSWNFPLFWTSLQTYMAAGWGRRVIILDNSPDHRILNDPCECFPSSSKQEYMPGESLVWDLWRASHMHAKVLHA